MAIVYKAINLINGESYIGITMRPFDIRRGEHLRKSRFLKSKFACAINKYGAEMFLFSIVKECQTFDEAKAEEQRLIALWKPEYNLTAGGDGVLGLRHSAEQRKRWSEQRRGKSFPRRPMSLEARQRLSALRRGKPAARAAGWKHTDEALSKMSESATRRPGYWKGKKLPQNVVELMRHRNSTPEWRARWAEFQKLGPVVIKKRVVCLNDGKVYESIAAAAQKYETEGSSISEVCNRSNIRLTAGGRVFRFLGDHYGGTEEANSVMIQARQRKLAGLMRARATYSSRGLA